MRSQAFLRGAAMAEVYGQARLDQLPELFPDEKLTATTSLLRGSHTRRRRSLQVVQNRLPFRFQLML